MNELEEYRQGVLSELRKNSQWIKNFTSKLLGLKVTQVWVIGSVLDSNSFKETSDIDIALVVKAEGVQGYREDLSNKIRGRVFLDTAGYLDISVFNKRTPIKHKKKL